MFSRYRRPKHVLYCVRIFCYTFEHGIIYAVETYFLIIIVPVGYISEKRGLFFPHPVFGSAIILFPIRRKIINSLFTHHWSMFQCWISKRFHWTHSHIQYTYLNPATLSYTCDIHLKPIARQFRQWNGRIWTTLWEPLSIFIK